MRAFQGNCYRPTGAQRQQGNAIFSLRDALEKCPGPAEQAYTRLLEGVLSATRVAAQGTGMRKEARPEWR